MGRDDRQLRVAGDGKRRGWDGLGLRGEPLVGDRHKARAMVRRDDGRLGVVDNGERKGWNSQGLSRSDNFFRREKKWYGTTHRSTSGWAVVRT